MKKSKVRIIACICAVLMLFCIPTVAACDKTENNTVSDQWAITLDFNDGISRDGILYVNKSESVTLPADPEREGYAFVGWETESGEEVSITYTPTDDVTLVAKWAVGTCNVTFDPNYANSEPIVQEIEYGSSISDPPTLERDGYNFRFWSVAPNGSEVDFASYPINGDYTFYAIWRSEDVNEFTVTFKLGAYEGAPADTTIVVLQNELINQSDAPAKNKPTRAGYTFVGWTAEQPEGDDWTIDSYPAANVPELVSLPFVPESDLTLHAVWTIGRYLAIFSVNYTDCPETNGIYTNEYYLSNQLVNAPATPPTRENYTFVGWYTAALGGTGVDFDAGVYLTVNTTYYAHWKHVAVQTAVFQAEYVEFDPNWIYFGYSSSVYGANCIVPDQGQTGTVMVDDYPLNSIVTTAGKGYFVSYQYEYGCTLRFEITSSQAAAATLIGSFAKESDLIDVIGPTGDNSNLILVNGESINYTPMRLTTEFEEYTIATIQLIEGVNVIEIVVNNNNTAMGVTYRAVGFMTDYIRLANYGSATLSWSPIYDNLEVVNKS